MQSTSEEEATQKWASLAGFFPQERFFGDSPLLSKAEEQGVCWTPELLEEVKRVRQALRTLCAHLVEEQVAIAENLETLNQILSQGYQSLQQTTQGTIIVVYRSSDQQQGRILLPFVLSALQLLTEEERLRLHKCKNERCISFFSDTTKSGTRQWYSLGCLNRARSIHRYQQIKKQTPQNDALDEQERPMTVGL